ncbi:50S ribosomal protein L11 [bacterium]|nr:50S ribosomal protein L11 [bacterium]
MANKPVKAVVKVQIDGAAAKPSPPLGPALGQHGVAIMEFCKAFNAATQDKAGQILPTVITIYEDRTFTFEVKSPPAAVLLMKAAGLEQGSSVPQKIKVGKVTWEQCQEIARTKMQDLNARDIEAATQIIAGTARSMGYVVAGHPTGRDDHFKLATAAEFEAMKKQYKKAPAAGGKKK